MARQIDKLGGNNLAQIKTYFEDIFAHDKIRVLKGWLEVTEEKAMFEVK